MTRCRWAPAKWAVCREPGLSQNSLVEPRIHAYAPHAGSTNCRRFSFVSDKRKKSRKLRSPACRASGPLTGPNRLAQDPASDNRPSKKEHDWPAKNSGCLATLLNRLEKFQQVGVDLIHICRGETVWHAWIENCLGSLDQLG